MAPDRKTPLHFVTSKRIDSARAGIPSIQGLSQGLQSAEGGFVARIPAVVRTETFPYPDHLAKSEAPY